MTPKLTNLGVAARNYAYAHLENFMDINRRLIQAFVAGGHWQRKQPIRLTVATSAPFVVKNESDATIELKIVREMPKPMVSWTLPSPASGDSDAYTVTREAGNEEPTFQREEDIEDVKQRLSEAVCTISHVNALNNQQRIYLQAERAKAEALAAKLQVAEKLLQECQQSFAAVQEQCCTLKTRNDNQASTLQAMNDEQARLRGQADTVQESLRNVTAAWHRSEVARENLAQLYASSDTTAAGLRGIIRERDDKIAVLENKLAGATSDRVKILENAPACCAAERNESKASLQGAINDIKLFAQNKVLQDEKLAQLTQALRVAEERLENQGITIDTLRRQRNIARLRVEELYQTKVTNISAETKLKVVEAQLKAETARSDSLRAELEQIEQDVRDVLKQRTE